MNDSPNSVTCPHCGASNYPSSASCWQCKQPLNVEGRGPVVPPPPQYPPYTPYPQPTARTGEDTQIYIILGFIFAGLAVFCCPLVFGVASIVMGAIACSKGNQMGVWVMVAGGVALLLGIIFGIFVMGFMRGFREFTIPRTRGI